MADMVDAFLPALDEGDEVTIFLGTSTHLTWGRIEHPSVRYVEASQKHPRRRAGAIELRKLVEQVKPDIWWSADTTLSPPKTKRHVCKSVYGVADLSTLLAIGKGPFWRRYLHQRRSSQNLMRADAIICPTKAISTRLIQLIGLSARHKTFMIANGVHPVFRQHSAEEILTVRRKHLIPQRYVLTTGSVSTAQFLTPVLKAMGTSEEVSSITCVVLGDAELHDLLRDEIRDCHLEGMVRFIDVKSLTPVEESVLYSGAAMLFEPSQALTFPYSILRALATGTPVICTANATNKELYGQAVLRVHPTDVREWMQAFTALTLSSTLRERQIERGLACAQNLTTTAMAKASFAFARLLCTVSAATIRKNNLNSSHD